MNRNRLSTLAKIVGGTLLALFLLAAIGPFLIPVRSSDGLVTAQEAATAGSQFLTIPFDGTDGIDIHYLTAGGELGGTESDIEAPTFVMLHGSLFNALSWNEVMDDFSAQGQVIAYDQIPYGLSEKLVPGDWSGPNPYTPEAAVEQLFTFLDELGIDKVVLVGHSYGGTLAAQAVLARPDRVDAVLFVDPAVYVEEEMPGWLLNLPQVRRLGPLFARQLGQNDGFMRAMYLDPDSMLDERLPLTRINTRVQNWDTALWEYLRVWSVNTSELATRIPEIDQPALVIIGDSDAVVPVADSRRLDSELPDSELVILLSCGHVPQEECPVAFADAVDAWLSQ